MLQVVLRLVIPEEARILQTFGDSSGGFVRMRLLWAQNEDEAADKKSHQHGSLFEVIHSSALIA